MVVKKSSSRKSLTKTSKIAIGAEIKDARERAGLTQKDLAGRLALSERMVSRIETGDVGPTSKSTRLVMGYLALGDGGTALGVSGPDAEMLSLWHQLPRPMRQYLLGLMKQAVEAQNEAADPGKIAHLAKARHR